MVTEKLSKVLTHDFLESVDGVLKKSSKQSSQPIPVDLTAQPLLI